VNQGKVRYLGCSTFPPSAIVEARWAAEKRNRERFVCEQPPYSMLARGVEAEVLPVCEKYGMGVIAWSPLAGGWLSGSWRLGAEDLTSRRSSLVWPRGRDSRVSQLYDLSNPSNQAKLQAADALFHLAAESGMSLIHLALAFVMQHPAVTAAIIGPRTMDHLEGQLGAPDIELDPDVLARIDEIVPPGTNFSWLDAGYEPPGLADLRTRRLAPIQ
jgi:aryl-alcohol dehydrogenase-like predicted oxidoreductase